MPHDVTMPQLGMAQDAGKIVSWLKAPGDAVAKGDALFEVETDKAVMEVESPAAGFLTSVAYAEGDDVPVGKVIARISDSAEDAGDTPPNMAAAPEPAAPDTLPEGHAVTMPQLGMAQDTGLLVAWCKAPGDAVAPEDILFEVETDKSTMEVEAGRTGWLAATLAEAGEEVQVGARVAIIADTKPEAPVARSARQTEPTPRAATPQPRAAQDSDPDSRAKAAATTPAQPAPKARQQTGGRILASPKARRLALERGLDLGRLAATGHPQPYHVGDLAVLEALPQAEAAPAAAQQPRRLTAICAQDGVAPFASWAAEGMGLREGDAILAGLAAASLGTDAPVIVAVDRFGVSRHFTVPAGRALGAVVEGGETPGIIVRDLRDTPVSSVEIGPEAAPVLTITRHGAGLSITLECAATQLDAPGAIGLLTQFAGRMEQPLRHLL